MRLLELSCRAAWGGRTEKKPLGTAGRLHLSPGEQKEPPVTAQPSFPWSAWIPSSKNLAAWNKNQPSSELEGESSMKDQKIVGNGRTGDKGRITCESGQMKEEVQI